MNNFEYCNPTHLIFGKGRENDIGSILLEKLHAGDTVLVVYGGKSAEKSGLIDRVRRSLEAAGLSAVLKAALLRIRSWTLSETVLKRRASAALVRFLRLAAAVSLMLPKPSRSACRMRETYGTSLPQA